MLFIDSEMRDIGLFARRVLLFVILLFILDRPFALFASNQINPLADTKPAKERQVFSLDNQQLRTAQILFVGNSHTAHAVNPTYITQATGRPSYNAGIGGYSSPEMILDLLQRPGIVGTPTVLVYGIDSVSLNETIRQENTLGKFLLQTSYAARFGTESIAWLRRISTDGWRLPAFKPTVVTVPSAFASFDRIEYWDNGLVAGYGIANPAENNYAVTPFAPVKPALAAFDAVAEFCRKKGIQLILLHIPEFLRLQADTPDRYQRFNNFMADFASRHRATYLDMNRIDRFPLADIQYFFDIHHLNAAGADLFSAKLGDELVRILKR